MDIAKAVGVSQATVSLALNNHPRISDAMKMRIHEAAEKMGYNPDPMLSALAQYRLASQDKPTQAALAWINPLRDPSFLRDQQEFVLYWKGATDAARRLGFRLEEFCTKDLSLDRMASMFKTRNIQGIIIAGMLSSNFEDETIDWKEFPWSDFATVRFGRKTSYPQSHFVTSAHTVNSIMAVKCIEEKGYRRIGYVGEYTDARIFCSGYFFAQHALPNEQRIPPLLFSNQQLDFSVKKQELKQWINTYDPDAILTDDALVLQMLQQLEIRIPDDIGLATTSIHDTPIDSGIDQNPKDIGRVAVRTLVALLNERSFGIPDVRNEILIEGKWKDGRMLPSRK